MDEGSIVLKKPFWDRLLFGLGFGDLCFRKNQERWIPILEVGQIRKSFRCGRCHTLIVENAPPET
jgi:hypothetical protein